MKKRILALVLAVAMISTMFIFGAISSNAETTMGKSVQAMTTELSEFIKTSQSQIDRDDADKMPEGQQTEHPLTAALKALNAEAKEVRKSKDAVIMDEFLVRIYGGWGPIIDPETGEEGQPDYLNANLPYTDYQNAFYFRTQPFDEVLYEGNGYKTYLGDGNYGLVGEGKGYNALVRKEYTIESWEKLADFMANLSKNWVGEDSEWHLLYATRSEIYDLFNEYFALYDQLEKVPEGTDLEVNRVKGYLFDIYNSEKHLYFAWDDVLATADLHEELPERDALKAWVDGTKAVLENPNATLEDLAPFIDTTTDDSLEYVKIRDALLETYRAAHFVGQQYSVAKDAVFAKAKADYDSGRYEDADWDAFMPCFDRGDQIKYSYTTKESELRSCIDEINAAYEILLTKRILGEQFEISYSQLVEFSSTIVEGTYKADSLQAFTDAIAAYDAAYPEYSALLIRLNEATDDAEKAAIEAEMVEPKAKLNELVLKIYKAKENLAPIVSGGGGQGGGSDFENILTNARDMLSYSLDVIDEGGDKFDTDSWNAYEAEVENLQTLIDKIDFEIEKEVTTYSVSSKDLLEAMLSVYACSTGLLLTVPETSN